MVGSVFNKVVGGRLESSNCLKKTLLNMFLGNSHKFSQPEFFQTSPEKYMKWLFLEAPRF